ncbi:MAG: DUF4097 family beta strand repeat protein [bacterium]|nr:DUF4097 family beta strand repeat protein [bacterium]
MNRRPLSPVAVCLVLIACLPTLLAATPARSAEITREFTFASRDLFVGNLVGAVEVRPGTGDAFRVTVHLRGDDMTADLVKLEQENDALRIRFPLDRHDKYVYPALGSGSRLTFSMHEEESTEKSWLRRTFRMISGRKVTVRGSGTGLEAWADVTVEVPAGRSFVLRHGAGEVTARGLQADLDLDTHVGAVRVDGLVGDLRADTGSGDVTVANVDGELDIDTGSGEVEVRDCKAGEARLDTGSGHVSVAGLSCRSLIIDTGSGGVDAVGVGADEATVDTGSGDVELRLDRMGSGRFLVDTGSGSVEIVLPADASASITADTGSGDIESRIAGLGFEKLDDGRRRLVVGGGEARVDLETCSGSVSVTRR